MISSPRTILSYKTFFLALLLLTIDFSCKELIKGDTYNSTPPVRNLNEDCDEIKILFIGNSLTGAIIPHTVDQMGISAEKTLIVDSVILYGYSFEAISRDEAVIAKIQETTWDYVFLQSNDVSAFPDLYEYEIQLIERFKSLIHNQSSTTKIGYMMLWGIRDTIRIQEITGDFVTYTYESYFEKIYWGTLYLANRTGVMISPVGYAWNLVSSDRPDLHDGLFDMDGCHPGYNGTYLAAAVSYCTIFTEELNNSFIGELTQNEAHYYQKIASDCVIENLPLWNHEMVIHEAWIPQELNITANSPDKNDSNASEKNKIGGESWTQVLGWSTLTSIICVVYMKRKKTPEIH